MEHVISERRLREFIEYPCWYHTIEITSNLITNGTYDHRPYLKLYGFPDILNGKTVLDVGTADGFFALELERRGAEKVIAIDTHTYDGNIGHTDISPSKLHNYEKKYEMDKFVNIRFHEIAEFFGLTVVSRRLIAAKLRNSAVNFEIDSVYNLGADGRQYDLVFCGDLIEHLKSPLTALEKLKTATREVCIISLSSALHRGIFRNFPKKALRNIFKFTGLQGDIFESADILRYKGNAGGGSFFSSIRKHSGVPYWPLVLKRLRFIQNLICLTDVNS